MRFFQNFSIKSKLIGIILIVSILAVGTGFTFVIINNIKTFKEDMVNNTIVNASLFGEYCVSPMTWEDKKGVAEILQRLKTLPSIMNGYVYDENGDLFAFYNRTGNEIIPPRLDEKPAAIFEGKYLHVVQPITYRGRMYGTIYLRSSTAVLDNKIKKHLITMIFLMVGLILISYFLAFRLQKILSIPILKLANVIQEISERGNFLVRVEKEGNDEIGALYDGFNEMMGHIQMRKQERDKAEEELRKHRERLEELVKERTSELEEKTKELENEVAIRKLIDKKLRTEKAYIDQLFESAQEAIVVVDKNSRALRVNREFLELFGYTINEVLGSSIDDLIAPKEYYDEAASVTKKILEGEKIGFETVRRRKDGTLFNVSVLASPIIVDDELVAIYGIYRDITKLKRAEEALVEAKHTAESANRAKSDFLANMSHELRTPLNAIIGFSQALQEQYFGALNKKQIDYIIDILESGQHLLAMINDILDLSKIEAGKMELELSKVKIKDLLANSLIMIKERCFKHGISLDLHFSQDLDNLEFIADERKLKQIMFNLLSNAAKFTPEGGEIKVEARREGKDFLISVSDTGIGIVSENQGKVFESFYQVNSKQEGKTPGTGLGLPLTKRLVEMQEGRIWMESEGKAKGSCFSFSVPIRKSVQKGKSEIKKRKKSNSHEQKG